MRIKVPKLKTPLWQELVYLFFVGLGPIVITALELFQSHSVWFKISFATIGGIFIVYFVIKRFVFNNYIEQLKQRIVMLEHDYSISNGNPMFIKQQWKTFNSIIYLLGSIQVLLALALTYLFITALTSQLIAFRGAATIILSMVVLGMAFKSFCYISIKVEAKDGKN